MVGHIFVEQIEYLTSQDAEVTGSGAEATGSSGEATGVGRTMEPACPDVDLVRTETTKNKSRSDFFLFPSKPGRRPDRLAP